jgi:hypothetical protein
MVDNENMEVMENEQLESEVIETNETMLEHEEQKREDKIPLNKYLEEKKRRRELEKRLREVEEKTLESENKNKLEEIREKVKSRGYDEDFAELMGEFAKDLLGSMPRIDKVEQEILEDIQDYADENPEVLKYKKQIVEKVRKYRKADPDFSIEDALNLITPAKVRVNELKTDVEQKQAIARRTAESKKVLTSTGASSPSNPYPLDEADKKALEGLQKLFPEKGWNAEKFHKLMKT